MDKYLTHTAEEYRKAVKVFKALVAMLPNKKPSSPAYEHERTMTALALEALRYAALRTENPSLTRAHLKGMHGQVIYSEQPGMSAGIVDCRSETIVTLGPQGIYRDEWFHGLPGRYYRFPVGSSDPLD